MQPADPVSLASQVAVVTGAARGIGRAVALRLARHAASVILTDLESESALLDEAVARIRQSGGHARACTADLTSRQEVDAVIAAAVETFGRLDILVNNAGIHLYPSPLLTVTETDWDHLFAVNVKGTLFACQAAIPHMTSRKSGSIINIASDSAFDVIVDEGAYGISKIAVVRLASYFAKELAGTGVRVNSLAPGWVKTRATEAFFVDPDAARALVEAVPARRVSDPDDIAGVVLFLATDLANYINGHCIVVDGGRVAGLPA